MRRFLLRRLAIATLLALLPALATAKPSRPIPAISRVLLVSVDGLRPDLALRAEAPSLKGLMARGSYSMWARTVGLAVTLPSHTSMLTGVSPLKHGVTWNDAQPPGSQAYPKWPTLFELARNAGYTTAMATGKAKFATLAKPGTLDASYVPGEEAPPDSVVADTAAAWIQRFAPEVLFVHFPQTDLTGHDHGWGSSEQMSAIAAMDRALGRVLGALKARGILDHTLVLVTADHGGAGTSHGPGDPRSLTIPWIVAGPEVRHDFDLTSKGLSVETEDTFATLCYVLGIHPERPVEGRPVLAIFMEAHHSVR